MRRIALTLVLPSLASLALVLPARPAHAAWPTGTSANVSLCTAPSSRTGPVLAPDSCGGAIMAWDDGRSGGLYATAVQRVDAFGQARWGASGFLLASSDSSQVSADVCSDDAGGAFVVWDENGFSPRRVMAHHVLSTGSPDPAWPTGGVAVSSRPYDQWSPRVVADGTGGAVVVWVDSGTGSVDLGTDLRAQRLDANGGLLWGADGVVLAGGAGNQRYFDAASDGAGGVVAAYADSRTGNPNIAAQRLDATGAPLWGIDGVVLGTTPLMDAGGQRVRAVRFESGRTYVNWVDYGSSTNDIRVQALGPAGTPLWAPNGVLVSNGSVINQSNSRATTDGLGGMIVAWSYQLGTNGIYRLVAQRVDASGAPRWSGGGITVRDTASTGVGTFQIESDTRNGAFVVWEDDRAPLGSWIDIYAQRVDANGAALWAMDGVPVTDAPGQQSLYTSQEPRRKIVPDGGGGLVTAWLDTRQLTYLIYAQQKGATGLNGVRAPSSNCMPDLCGHAYTDFGDAPEDIPAFPSGAPGHYPTCTSMGTPGTQEILCGAAPSTAPGPTGYVEHVATASDSVYFGLGCGAPQAPGLAVTAETDGITGVSGSASALLGGPSACSPGAVVAGAQQGSAGLWFATDEIAGGNDAGLATDPVFIAGEANLVRYKAWLCAGSPLSVRLNVLVDWNQDGDWNDVLTGAGPGGAAICVPEWVVRNVSVTLQPGCNDLTTPAFMAGAGTGASWMRVTLTAGPVSKDFPWAGSVSSDASAPSTFAGGETEDYPVSVVTSTSVGPSRAGVEGLAPVTPNPTRGASLIRFTLASAGRVRLAVYDLAGRRVRVLVDGARAAGEHDLEWDGRAEDGARVRPGMYFVRLDGVGRGGSRTVVRLE